MKGTAEIAPQSERLLLTVDEVARMLGTGPARVRRLVNDGDLRAHRFGRKVLIAPSAVTEFVENAGRETS